MPEPRHQPVLKCPFCGGKKFDIGRDLYSGYEKVLYCHRSPDPGHRPEEDSSLEIKGAVCMTCGYVAMMVDIRALYGPARRAEAIARALEQDRKPSLQGLKPRGDEPAEEAPDASLGDLAQQAERAEAPGPAGREPEEAPAFDWTAPAGGENEEDPADALRRLMEEGQSE